MITKKLKVFLADDHEMILPGLKMAVESIDGFSVIGTQFNVSKIHGINRLKPA